MTVLTLDVIARDRASKVLAGIGKKTDETSGKFTRWGAAAAGAGVIVGASLIKFGKDSVKAYSDSQEGQKRLQDAFERFPKLADTNQKALQKLNTALQKKTKYDDDNIASGQAVLAQFGVTGTQLRETTPLLLDYASKTGKDIPAAAQDVGKALLGNAKALKNIGIKYTATGDTQKDFTNITALMRAQVGGFATKEGQTAAGQAAILKNQFGEVEETVGSQLVPALMKLLGGLLAVIRVVQNYAQFIVPLIAGIAALTIGIYALVVAQRISTFLTKQQTEQTILYTVWSKVAATASKVWAAGQWLLNAALSANPIALIIIGVAALVAGIILAYKHSETFRAIVQAAFGAVLRAVSAAWNWIKGHWPLLLAVLTGPIGLAVKFIHDHWGGIVTKFKGIPGKIGKVIGGVVGVLTSPFRTAFNAIADLWNGTAGKLSFHVPDWVPGIGGKGFSMPQLPHLARGTRDFQGGFATVGERGEETVWMPGGSRVWPHGQGPAGSDGAGDTINITVNGAVDANGVARQIVQILTTYKRRNGAPLGLA